MDTVVAGVLGVLGGMIGAWALLRKPRALKATRFTLIDEDGKEKGYFGRDRNKATVLQIGSSDSGGIFLRKEAIGNTSIQMGPAPGGTRLSISADPQLAKI